jgi:hypothetical protein
MKLKSVLKKIIFALVLMLDFNALSAETMTPVSDDFKVGIASSITN